MMFLFLLRERVCLSREVQKEAEQMEYNGIEY